MITSTTLPFVDLIDVPFTVNHSRFLLRRIQEGLLGLYYVRYEVPLRDCLVATLPLTGQTTIHEGHVSNTNWTVALSATEARVVLPQDRPQADIQTRESPNIRQLETDTGIRFLDVGNPEIIPSELDDQSFTDEADEVVTEWMRRCPAVRLDREAMTRQCWWVLGTNQVDLHLPDGRVGVAVVPSKVGYVGLWQWDAYFIALGLRHGAPLVAAQQVDIAFTPDSNGMLPDVVHENGTLASSEDLPAADIKTLRAKSKTDTDEVVPLTKPPLAAWAAEEVARYLPDDVAAQYWAKWRPIIRSSQKWWLRHGDEQPPRYEHPYSSGLDDSPVFDEGGAVVSPDLLAYLIHQQEIIDSWTDSPIDEGSLRQLQDWLGTLWDPTAATYLPTHLDMVPIQHQTILSLLALFAGVLPDEHVSALVKDIEDPSRFGASWPLPTVAMDDATFSPEEMWRGPTWVNTNYLVADGLERLGYSRQAHRLRQKTLDGLEHAGGPVEHYNPLLGTRAETATVSFGWSASLYVDLAVREASDLQNNEGL